MRKLLLFILLSVGTAEAATKVSVTCTPPTTRTSGASLPASEIKNYQFFYQLPGATEQGPFASTACSYTLPIAEGSCVKSGAIFSVTATDTDGQVSARATASLAGDACNPKAKPSAPGGVKIITVE